MVIRFDHLTYVCNNTELEYTLSKFTSIGYREVFREECIPNIPPKKPLLKHPNEKHSLFFLEKDNSIPIEVISYELTTHSPQMIEFASEGCSFTYNTRDVEYLKLLFESIGFKRIDEQTYNAKGVLDKNDSIINIKEAVNPSALLDNEGFTCPTIFIDSYVKTKAKVEENGFTCTESYPIVINGRDLKIFFAIGKTNEIIELISNK